MSVTITNLPTNSNPSASDYLVTDDGSTTSKAQLANLRDGLGMHYFNTGSTASATITVPSGYRGLLITVSSAQTYASCYILYVTSTGVTGSAPIYTGSNISITNQTNAYIVSSLTSNPIQIFVIDIAGTASIN